MKNRVKNKECSKKIEKSCCENKKEKNMKLEFFAKGKRGIVYTSTIKGKKVAVKIKNPESTAIARIENEAKFLRIVNKKDIGPKLIKVEKDKIIYEFQEGMFFHKWMKEAKKEELLKAVKNILEQCFILDSLGINKEEMMRPYKNVIVTNKKIVLIDFERANFSKRPVNVTQFVQFLINYENFLKNKKIIVDKEKLKTLCKKYKNNIENKKLREKNFENIEKEINNHL